MKKRIISIIVVLVLFLSLTACSTDSSSDEGTTTTGNDTETTTTGNDTGTTSDKGSEKIKLSGTQLGYNDDQIAAAEAKEEGCQ